MSDAAASPQVLSGAAHRFPIRVYYEDTDAGGIVYYANYLKFAERARTEMMREAGAPHSDMVNRFRCSFAVRHCEVDYFRPARLDDLLDVETRILELGGATVDAEQLVMRDGTELARIRVRLACITETGRAVRVPAEIRAAFNEYHKSQERA
ncbi:tol-pal system-associated acyl-CoA thioesterase [Rhodospirillaceae bacterium SYSU D60014]|uniref:tol-pal system-associated acyl-CoA thioesterase n=1 Tax=Virgifigura deserti TaxID=2268457 RepID=UPI000E6746EB